MTLNHLLVTANIVFVDPTYAYLALVFIGAGVLLMYLIVRSSDEYSVEETEENSEDFRRSNTRLNRTCNQMAMGSLCSIDYMGNSLFCSALGRIRHFSLNAYQLRLSKE